MPSEPVQTPPPASGWDRIFFRFWRYSAAFWRGPSARGIQALSFMLLVVVLLTLWTQYRLNIWNRDFFDALGQKNGPAIFHQALILGPLVAGSIALAILAVWGRMTAQRKWRNWLTQNLIEQWLANDRYRRLAAEEHQNSEYRITEDARVATEAPPDFAVGLLTSLLTAILFISVLWNVGGDLTVTVSGQSVVLPGYLVIAAFGYASVTTLGMLFIGRRLVHVYGGKNQAEADFRSTAAHLRENAEQKDNHAEVAALHASLAQAIGWWRKLCWQLMQTTLISQGNSLLAPVFALVICAPKYLSGSMSLGEVTQAAAAFVTVQGAFNWMVDNYPSLADWASSANRVGALLSSLDALDQDTLTSSEVDISEVEINEVEVEVKVAVTVEVKGIPATPAE